MATYIANYCSSSGERSVAFTYNAATKALVSADSRCVFESVPGDYWAIKINGDYSLAFDSDGLITGDIVIGKPSGSPRIDFICKTCGINSWMGSLTQDGVLHVRDLSEADTLPETGLNINDQIAFTPGGVCTTTSTVNEAWFLACSGNYLTHDGKLIVIRP